MIQELVSVVVPARNEEASIAACLASILNQDHANIEVLVVDGASDDATREIVQRMMTADERIVLLDNPRRTIPCALNVGLSHARGAFFVRVDAHSTIGTDYVSHIVGHLRSGRWGGAGGRIIAEGRTSAGRAIGAADASPFGVGNSRHHYGDRVQVMDHVTFGAYPVPLARALGGWNESLLVNEDFEFDYRVGEAGQEIVFDPEIDVHWTCRQSVGALFRQYVRYGRGKPRVLRLHPRSLKIRQLVPPALVLWIALIAGASFVRPLALLGALPYALVLVAGSLHTGRHVRGIGAKLWLPAAFAAMHLGWGIGFWTGVAGAARGVRPAVVSRPRPAADRRQAA